MAEKRLLKEYKQLVKCPPWKENRQIISLEPLDTSDVFHWKAVIAKPTREDSAYYYNGQWSLDIDVDPNYPVKPPRIKFERSTPICHPNINIESGEICLDILKSEGWSPAWNLQYLVVAILMLLDNPEPDSPLNIDLANLYRFDKTAFESVVQYNIWKYGTFYRPDGMEIERNLSGLKNNNEIKHETNDEQNTRNECEASAFADASKESLTRLANPPLITVGGQQIVEENSQYKIIQECGEEVTRKFMDKVNEISHSASSSQGSSGSENDLNSVKAQVAQNVTKQVERLCLNTTSPTSANFVPSSPFEFPDKEIEEKRQIFIKHVDQQIEEYNERLTGLNITKPDDVSEHRSNYSSSMLLDDDSGNVDMNTSVNDSESNTLAESVSSNSQALSVGAESTDKRSGKSEKKKSKSLLSRLKRSISSKVKSQGRMGDLHNKEKKVKSALKKSAKAT